MFAEGFEKTAFIMPAIRAAGNVVGAVGKGGLANRARQGAGAIGGGLTNAKNSFVGGMRAGAGRKLQGDVGAGAARRAVAKAQAAGPLTPKMQTDLAANAQKSTRAKIDARIKKNKPSFAQKHPYLTAGMAAGAGAIAFGGGGQEHQPSQPVVYQPYN
jgi:hypothetical protein